MAIETKSNNKKSISKLLNKLKSLPQINQNINQFLIDPFRKDVHTELLTCEIFSSSKWNCKISLFLKIVKFYEIFIQVLK